MAGLIVCSAITGGQPMGCYEVTIFTMRNATDHCCAVNNLRCAWHRFTKSHTAVKCRDSAIRTTYFDGGVRFRVKRLKLGRPTA